MIGKIYLNLFQTEFKHTLEAESSLETWASWLESVVEKVKYFIFVELFKINTAEEIIHL